MSFLMTGEVRGWVMGDRAMRGYPIRLESSGLWEIDLASGFGRIRAGLLKLYESRKQYDTSIMSDENQTSASATYPIDYVMETSYNSFYGIHRPTHILGTGYAIPQTPSHKVSYSIRPRLFGQYPLPKIDINKREHGVGVSINTSLVIMVNL
jgi:hypothetical protein